MLSIGQQIKSSFKVVGLLDYNHFHKTDGAPSLISPVLRFHEKSFSGSRPGHKGGGVQLRIKDEGRYVYVLKVISLSLPMLNSSTTAQALGCCLEVLSLVLGSFTREFNVR